MCPRLAVPLLLLVQARYVRESSGIRDREENAMSRHLGMCVGAAFCKPVAQLVQRAQSVLESTSNQSHPCLLCCLTPRIRDVL